MFQINWCMVNTTLISAGMIAVSASVISNKHFFYSIFYKHFFFQFLINNFFYQILNQTFFFSTGMIAVCCTETFLSDAMQQLADASLLALAALRSMESVEGPSAPLYGGQPQMCFSTCGSKRVFFFLLQTVFHFFFSYYCIF